MDPQDPAVFLKSPPILSDRAETLTRQVDKHAGADVEWWRFAELAVRHHDHAEWIGERGKLEDKIRSRARWAVGALIANLALVASMVAHRLEANGAAAEREAEQQRSFMEYRDTARREMDELRRQISELRADFRRWSGLQSDPPRAPDSDIGYNPDPDKLADLGIWGDILASGAPRPKPRSTCGSICNSSIECSQGVLKPCPFCNFGVCKSTRPEQPQPPPPDAGVDAPGGTAP